MLTQRVKKEWLENSRERLEAKWKVAQRWLRRLGPTGFACVAHCNWSRHGGFHFHYHVVAEFPGSVDLEGFSEAWSKLEPGSIVAFYSRVSKGRTAAQCGEPQDLFGHDDAVGSGIGYVVGEIVKGVGAFGVKGCPTWRLSEVATALLGMKRVRLYMGWRSAVVERDKAEKAEKEKAAEKEGTAEKAKDGQESDFDYSCCPTVDDAYTEARGGVVASRDLLKGLVERYPGPSYFAGRVRAFCLEGLVLT